MSKWKPLKSIGNAVSKVAGVAGAVTGLGLGGTIGAAASAVTGFLGSGSTLAKGLNTVAALSPEGQAAALSGGNTGDALISMLIGNEAGDAQKKFIEMALNGGMTPDAIAQSKKFQELNYARATGAQQTADDGLKAFQEAQTELKAISGNVAGLTPDYSAAIAQRTTNQGVEAQQQANVNALTSKTANTGTQQQAIKQLTGTGQTIQQGLSGVQSAIKGLASSYGMRGIGESGTNPTAGSSMGQFNQTLGVAQGDLVSRQSQELQLQLQQARAAGATPAQLAEMQRRGEMAIQEEASRLAIANEREGANAMLQAQQSLLPFIEAGTQNAQALSQTDLSIQQMDAMWLMSAQQALANMRQQGMTEEEIQRQMAEAKASYDMQKSQLQASIQQSIASGNITAAQLGLADLAAAMSTIGSNLSSNAATGAQGMNAATNMISDMMKAQAEAYANAGKAQAAAGTNATSTATDFLTTLIGTKNNQTTASGYTIGGTVPSQTGGQTYGLNTGTVPSDAGTKYGLDTLAPLQTGTLAAVPAISAPVVTPPVVTPAITQIDWDKLRKDQPTNHAGQKIS